MGDSVYCNYVDIDESSTIDNEVKVYPNPASNCICIELNEMPERQLECKIYDMFGRVVLKPGIGSGQKNTLDVSGLSPGIYLIAIDNKVNVFPTKVVIR